MRRLLWLTVLLSPLPSSAIAQPDVHVDVSLVSLISTPSIYWDKPISVKGILSIEVENNAIWLSREDREYSVTKNAMWIKLSSQQFRSFREMDGKFVRVEGTFLYSDCNGHFCLFSGTINPDRIDEIFR